MRTLDEMEWKHIKNDINGNSRWVCHWMTFEKKPDYSLTLSERYANAVALANQIGGRKFRNKDYGGGIVFQCYGPEEMLPHIQKLMDE
jgi:hypothetical protein